MKGPILALRLAFGAPLVLFAANHLFLAVFPEPGGTQPLAVQLMGAFQRSHLFDVAMGIALVAGLLIMAGIAVPFALAVTMPIEVCALYWALVLEHDPLWSALALAALAANAALMLTQLEAYRGVLQRRALAAGEDADPAGHYDGLFMNPSARTPAGPLLAALAVLLAALAFYWWWVPSRTGHFAMLVLLVPAALLLLGGVRGMGKRA
ncbi:MAG: hypothetical protein ABIP41_08780 [Croceibacterium sp.]